MDAFSFNPNLASFFAICVGNFWLKKIHKYQQTNKTNKTKFKAKEKTKTKTSNREKKNNNNNNNNSNKQTKDK